MKKICFITTVSATLTGFVLSTAEYLHEHGDYTITFICDEDDEFRKLLPSYIRYISVSMKRGISIAGIGAMLKMREIFRREKFDFVQYSTPNASLYASIASKSAHIPIRLYCQWGIRYTGMEGLSRRIFKAIEKVPCKLSTHIRAVSFKNYDFAVGEGLYPRDKAKVLGKGGTIGVDLDLFDIANKAAYRQIAQNRYEIQGRFVFGFVGRISKDKGINELIAAFRNIANDNGAVLLIVGCNEMGKGINPSLYDWAAGNNSVIFTGWVPNSELKKYYAAIDCYVHPTYREGFGMVLQEAAAMGDAIITTDIPGASEVMEKDVSCLLVSPKDATALETAMRKVMGDQVLYRRLGDNARARTERYFNRKIMLENQLKDYDELLNGKVGMEYGEIDVVNSRS